jgi:hypothetical protein
MIMPYANPEAMNVRLVEVSAQIAPGARAVLICDGAGWHQRDVVPARIGMSLGV